MRKTMILLAIILVLSSGSDIFARYAKFEEEASVTIIDYPAVVTPCGLAEIKVAWDGVDIDKGYILRLQLENWDIDPGICITKDITEFSTRGTSTISLEIPSDIRPAEELRFIVTFISGTGGWDDVLCMTATSKDVSIKGLLEILDYPKLIFRGESAQVKVEWRGLPEGMSKDYRLLVQLENWDIEPGVVITQEIKEFESEGDHVVSLDIPEGLNPVSSCSFVAAFLSRSRGWDDVFYIVRTDKDVEIR